MESVELRKIKQGGAFTLSGSDDRYIRGPYRRDSGEFLCRHPASMTHHYFPASTLVERAK